MKTMKRGEEVKRVKETEVKRFLGNGWGYCPKGEWKKVRGQVKEVSVQLDGQKQESGIGEMDEIVVKKGKKKWKNKPNKSLEEKGKNQG